MNKPFVLPILLFLTLGIAGGCAPAAPTVPPPTSTPIVYPATFTPQAEQPTVTPTATVTGIPPTRTPDAETQKVVAAFLRTSKLTVYQANMTIAVTDPTGSIPDSKPNEPLTLMSFQGRLNQGNTNWVWGGELAKKFGGDPVKGIQFVQLGTSIYLHGPAAPLGANQDAWYLTALTPDNIADQLPQFLFTKLAAVSGSFPTMHSVGNEELDKKPCIKYQGDTNETGDLFRALFSGGVTPTAAPAAARHDSLFVWVCDDTYVHQWEWNYQLPASQATTRVTMHLNDLNIVVPIDAPPDAIQLPQPFTFPTPIAQPFAAPTSTS